MSEMADRIGRVIAFGMGTDEAPENIARKVLEAMRKPTEAMSNAGFNNEWCSGPDLAWEAMIDAALR